MMTGRARQAVLEQPDPTPEPIPQAEAIAAKDRVKTRAKRTGRGANILAGRLMQGRQILNTGQLKLGA